MFSVQLWDVAISCEEFPPLFRKGKPFETVVTNCRYLGTHHGVLTGNIEYEPTLIDGCYLSGGDKIQLVIEGSQNAAIIKGDGPNYSFQLLN